MSQLHSGEEMEHQGKLSVTYCAVQYERWYCAVRYKRDDVTLCDTKVSIVMLQNTRVGIITLHDTRVSVILMFLCDARDGIMPVREASKVCKASKTFQQLMCKILLRLA